MWDDRALKIEFEDFSRDQSQEGENCEFHDVVPVREAVMGIYMDRTADRCRFEHN